MDTLPPYALNSNSLHIDIRAMRKHKGYTQFEIAQILGVSSGLLSNVENGKKHLSIDHIRVIEQLPPKEAKTLKVIGTGCGQVFTASRTRSDAKFCSSACWIKYQNSQVLERQCPQCNEVIIYKTYGGWLRGKKLRTVCQECKYINLTGEKNGFYGKNHSLKSREKMSAKTKGKHRSPYTEFKKGQETLNKTPHYQIWLQKYGKEEADNRLKQFKQKQSLINSGNKNNMYGKPTPQGSGNGWSGWYKGFYFRSLHELSYIVNFLEKQNLHFESAEQKKYRVTYIDWNGRSRTYYADFIVDHKIMVECKPTRLHASKTVILKAEAAKQFCLENGLEYIIIDPPKLETSKIKALYESKLIQWLPRYQKMYKDRYGN